MRNVRKNMNAFIDGQGYAGQVEEFNAPKITLKTEDFQGGGMLAPMEITMGHEKLNSDLTLLSDDPDILSKFSITEGSQVPFTVREVLESHDGTVTARVHTMRGKVKSIDPGSTKPGQKSQTKVELALSYYKLTHGTRVIFEIDVINMVFVKDGVDAMAAQRTALGI